MNKTILIVIIVAIAVLGGYFLLKGGYQTPTSSPTPASGVTPGTVDETTVTPEGTSAPEEVPISAVREVLVIGTEFAFSPSTITVQAGEQVKINFQNGGSAPHNLVIEDLGVKTRTIGGGQTDTIEFTAPVSGTYTIFCSIPGHKAAGMEGSLLVE